MITDTLSTAQLIVLSTELYLGVVLGVAVTFKASHFRNAELALVRLFPEAMSPRLTSRRWLALVILGESTLVLALLVSPLSPLVLTLLLLAASCFLAVTVRAFRRNLACGCFASRRQVDARALGYRLFWWLLAGAALGVAALGAPTLPTMSTTALVVVGGGALSLCAVGIFFSRLAGWTLIRGRMPVRPNAPGRPGAFAVRPDTALCRCVAGPPRRTLVECAREYRVAVSEAASACAHPRPAPTQTLRWPMTARGRSQ